MIAVPATGNVLELVGAYVQERIQGLTLVPGMYSGFAIMTDTGELAAAVVISNFRQMDCEISCASETPLAWRPHVCKAVFSYIFDQLGCARTTCITTKRNKQTRAFLSSLGFKLEGNVRLGYDGKRDALIYGLLRSECVYVEGLTNGEEKRSSGPGSTGPDEDGAGAGASQQGDGDSASEPEPD